MSSPTGGHSGNLSPDAVRTSIDGVMWERYEREDQPAYLSATDGWFFKQGQTVGVSFIFDEDSGVSDFQETGEQEDISTSDSRLGNKKTINSQKYTKRIPVSDEAFRADQVGKREMLGQQIGDAARRTRDKNAILDTFGDAFSGSVNTTPDGQAPASNSHTTLTGVTVDNLETGALNPDNLWTVVNSLANQRGQHGDAGSYVFGGIVVPFVLYKTAKEVMNSQLAANSAENNLNIFDTDYGFVRIKSSVFLNSQYNSATNANTSYHVLSENAYVCRKEFYGLTTDWIEPRYTTNDVWQHLSKFHEVSFFGTWAGYVASNGTA